MALALEKCDSSSKCKCQALGNLRDKAQNARHAGHNKARLPGICLTLLQEKLVAPLLFQGIHHWRLLTKDLVSRKFYSIALTDLRSEILVMLGIRVKVKLDGVTHQVEPEDRSGGKRKTRAQKDKQQKEFSLYSIAFSLIINILICFKTPQSHIFST